MNRGELFAVQPVTETRGLLVADLARQSDRLGHDVIRRHEVVAQPDVLEGLKDLDDASVVLVFRRHHGAGYAFQALVLLMS